MNLIEAYAQLDSEVKKTSQRLDEKIPGDLAKAMRDAKDWDITADRHGREPFSYDSGWVDFENNEYTKSRSSSTCLPRMT